jgi:hypothetical protein
MLGEENSKPGTPCAEQKRETKNTKAVGGMAAARHAKREISFCFFHLSTKIWNFYALCTKNPSKYCEECCVDRRRKK